jgi:hypothetical protein
VAWSSGWKGTIVVITYVWCNVYRTGEVELEIDGRERIHHFEIEGSTTVLHSFEGTGRSSERKGGPKKVG